MFVVQCLFDVSCVLSVVSLSLYLVCCALCFVGGVLFVLGFRGVLLVARFLLFGWLFVVRRLLRVVCCWLLVVCCSLFDVSWSALCVCCCGVFVVRCSLFVFVVVRYAVFVARCSLLLFLGRHVSFVDCWCVVVF